MRKFVMKLWGGLFIGSILAVILTGCSGSSSDPSVPDQSNPFSGVFKREASYPNNPGSEMVDWVLTVHLIQSGTTVTGTFQGDFTSSCCQGTVATPVNGTIDTNNVAHLSWQGSEGQCDGPVCSFRGTIAGGESDARLTNNGTVLHFDVTGSDYFRQ